MAVTTGGGAGGVRVYGAARLERTMAAAGRGLAGAPMAAAAARSGPLLAAAVKARTPRRSGRLAASVRVDPAGGDRLSVSVSASAGHAPAIEYGVGARPGLRGGHNIRARRMLAGGLAAAAPAAEDNAGRAVQAVMARVKGD